MQKRHRHFIRPVTRLVYPTQIAAVAIDAYDCQSDNVEPSSGIGIVQWTVATAALKNGIVQKSWQSCGCSAATFWQYIEQLLRHNTSILLVSANTWIESIILGFWQGLEDGRLYLDGFDPRNASRQPNERCGNNRGYWVIENPPTILNFRLKSAQGSIKWIDLRNFGLSKWIGTVSGSISAQLILGTLLDILRFLREKNLGSLQTTAASQALHSYKYRYLRHTIHVSTNETQNTLAKASLFGGRNECYRLGEIQGPITQFDFNSLYPAVYSREALPVRLQDIRSNPSNSDIASAIKSKNCIASVMVDTDVPCLPKRQGKTLIFPVGRFWTTICWPELEIALNECKSVRITCLATYDMELAFADYANELYDYRVAYNAKGSGAVGACIKSMLVSLPGKFGQSSKLWQFCKDQRAPGPWRVWYHRNADGSLTKRRSVAWYVEEERRNGLGYESVPEIAAWVNSWGRRILLEEMKRVGRERIVYVDTDSLWVYGTDWCSNRANFTQSTTELGKMRIVDTYKQVALHGLKHYETISYSGSKNSTPCKHNANYAGGGVSGLAGISWHCHSGIPPKLPVYTKVGTGCGPYTHGKVHPDLSVSPIELEEW